jgi:hypothetical protein
MAQKNEQNRLTAGELVPKCSLRARFCAKVDTIYWDLKDFRTDLRHGLSPFLWDIILHKPIL